MGFDVTFHPVSERELDHFFFDVLRDPSVAEARAAEASADPDRRRVVRKLYRAFPRFRAAGTPVASSFAFGAAIIAGFLRPYWYARGQAFSLLPSGLAQGASELFVPFGRLAAGILADVPDPSGGRFAGNNSASGLIPADRIERAERLVDLLADPGGQPGQRAPGAFDADGLASLRAALRYCREERLGLIEATDVVVPLTGESYSDPTNLRAPFLGKIDP